jgi:ferric-dicitrate binding protein FerR (iron transport regulator)
MKEELDNYFLGELTDREKAAFFDRVQSDETLKSDFIGMQNAVALSKLYPQKDDEQTAIRKIAELEKRIGRKRQRLILWKIARYAAVIALLVTNALLFFMATEKEDDEAIAYTKIEVPSGQRVAMTLTDGTKIWLSPRSVLQIPDKFEKNERMVRLDGEGYFSVAKDAKRPFVVHTEQYNIKALGTRFNVFAYTKSNRFEADLLDGEIEVSMPSLSDSSTTLHPGEKVVFTAGRRIKLTSQFNNEEYLKNGIFVFNNKRFGEILEYLALWYDVGFEIEDSAKKELPVSGKFRQSDEIRVILKALQGVHKFKYREIDEKNIEIY